MISDGVIEFYNRRPPNQKRMLNCASYNIYLILPNTDFCKIGIIHTSTIHVINPISPIDERVRDDIESAPGRFETTIPA